MSTLEQRKEHARRWGENPGDAGRREYLRPVTMETIARNEEANKLIIDGMMSHYWRCVCTGRLDVWVKALHAVADLIACDRVEFVRRAAFQVEP